MTHKVIYTIFVCVLVSIKVKIFFKFEVPNVQRWDIPI